MFYIIKHGNILYKIMYIKASTISDFWFFSLKECLQNGYRQDIQKGSFEKEEYRLQLPFLSGEIIFPLLDIVPTVPIGVPQPTTLETIEKYYCDYIIGNNVQENETYTYGSRIGEQLPKIMEMLKLTPQTNQAVIEIGRPEDLDISDPACLRLLDFKVVDNKLNLTSYWRSNDLFFGTPTNLGGLAYLQRDVAEYAELEIGQMYYCSSGIHLYGYQVELAKTKCGG